MVVRFAGCVDIVMTGFATTDDIGVIKDCRGERICIMAAATVGTGHDMGCRLTQGEASIMA